MLDVKELHRNTEFQDWFHNLNRNYLDGNVLQLELGYLSYDIDQIRAWAKDGKRFTTALCWDLIKDVIRYRICHKANGPYAVPDTEDGLPDVYADAIEAVLGARNVDYGAVWGNFSDIAELTRKTGGNPKQTPVDVALDIMCIKVGRLMHTPDHYDSLVDLIGYTLCLFQIFDYLENEAEKRRDTEKIEKPKEA